MSGRQLIIVVILLSLAGFGLMAYKSTVLGFPLTPDRQSELWTIEARVGFERYTPGSVKARLRIPNKLVNFGLLNENFVSRGFGLSIQESDDWRVAMWAIRRTEGRQGLYYRLTVFRDEDMRFDLPAPPFPEVPRMSEPFASALQDIVAEVRQQSADVQTFTSGLLRRMNAADSEDAVSLFLDSTRNDLDRALLATTLLAGARIPARVLQVLPLSGEPHRMGVIPWLAVHNGEDWLFFNPTTGDQGLSKDMFIWSWDGTDLVDVSGGLDEKVEFWVNRTNEDVLSVAERRAESHGSRLVEFSLLDLPLQTQAVYGVLIMIPIGALMIVLMRNLVGVRTFGTFLPILVALAFRETQLVAGIILFMMIIGIGLAVRFYLERLHLLLVPRLASVLTIVVLLMIGVGILSHRLGIETGLSVALFPMVIMTMVIERMSVVWEERGAGDATIEGAGTLFVASCAYWLMGLDIVQHLVFVFPEILLIALAFMLLFGRYTGYRLSEIKRFKAIRGLRK
jgi:hypothetical protein